jgi:hypothetical protein
MARPIVYLSAEFFVSFCKHLRRPTEEVPDTVPYLKNLIFQKAQVFINLSDEKILRITSLLPEDIARIEDEDEKILADKLKPLLDNNLVKSCKQELEIFRANNYSAFNSLQIKPHFVFLENCKEQCKKISKEFGIICISKELELDPENTRVEIKTIESKTNIQLDSIMRNMRDSHGIIIVDPYLYKEVVFLERFLAKLIKTGLKVNHAITLICSDKDIKDKTSFEKSIQTIRNNNGLNIDLFFTRYIHDRVVFSNSFYLTCGYGFKDKYPDVTEWHIPAIGTYFDQYSDLKTANTKFLKSEPKKSLNYLTN